MKEYRHGGFWYFARDFGTRLERTIELTKSQLLASKTGGFGASHLTSRWSRSRCPLGRIRRIPPHGANRSTVDVYRCQSSRQFRPQSPHQSMPSRSFAGDLRWRKNSTPSNVRQLPREGVINGWRDETAEGAACCSHTSCWPCADPILTAPSWFSAPPGLALPMESRPDYCRNELLYRAGDIERHPGPRRALPVRGRDVVSHGLTELGHACFQYLRSCFASGSLGLG